MVGEVPRRGRDGARCAGRPRATGRARASRRRRRSSLVCSPASPLTSRRRCADLRVLDPAIDRPASPSRRLSVARARARRRPDRARRCAQRGRRPALARRAPLPMSSGRISVPKALNSAVRIFAGDVSTPATIGDPTPVLKGADDLPLVLPPGGFSQATEEGNAQLARRVAALAGGCQPCRRAVWGRATSPCCSLESASSPPSSRARTPAPAHASTSPRGLTAKVIEADAATFVIPKPTRPSCSILRGRRARRMHRANRSQNEALPHHLCLLRSADARATM